MMHMFDGYGMGMGPFGMIFMVLFWALVIAGIIYLVRLITGGGKSPAHEETAEEIVKKRYARGEISKEEFEAMKKDLADVRPD